MTPDTAWHSLPAAEVLRQLAGDADGLPGAEAARRLDTYGRNVIAAGRPYSPLRRFFAQFHNVLIGILMVAALVTAAMRHWTDAGVIVAVILINALIGFFQERKAEQALAAIRNLLSLQATVLRDGAPHLLEAALLVPGDVVVLTAGDKVPADLRLLSAHALRTQEGILTGESLDVEKSAHAVAEDAVLGDRHSIAYSGTLVTSGQGRGVVVATGAATQIGRISALVSKAESPQTPLTLKLARFSRLLAAGIVTLSLAAFFFGVYGRGLPMNEMFMVMIGIAVSAIPEGLPAVISITMALGMRAMATRHAIVRHLPVIESLGSVTVICTDKTGTLTKNELAVTDIVTAERQFSVSGVGYAPDGSIWLENQEIVLAAHPTVGEMGCAALLNNDAALTLKKGVWELNGDPTEGALMAFARKAGQQEKPVRETWPRADVIPFSAESRTMATLHHHADGRGRIYIKGAPEQILAMCRHEQCARGQDQPLRMDYWQAQVNALAREGKRVLAIAHRHVPSAHRNLKPADIEEGLTLLGLFGIMDTPREEARAAIAACRSAGIAVKMITGDHVLTASAMGAALAIPASEKVMTGTDIDRLSDAALTGAIAQVNIFARMHPEHKLRLVRAFQAMGEVVAMTGDGVNDAPALKSADIGIAMGKQGTEVAKEAAGLVLADDNFASIVHAVEEGRTIYRNIKRTIQFMLVTDGAEGLTLLLAVLAGFTLPITPLQILWVNMVTAVTLSLAFAFSPHAPSVMCRAPLPPEAPLFSRGTIRAMVWHIAIITVGTITLFLYELKAGSDLATARTMAVNALVFFQIYYLWGIFPLQRSRAGLLPVVLATFGVMVFQAGFTYLPWMQHLFATAPLGAADWLKIIGISALILLWLRSGKPSGGSSRIPRQPQREGL
ncbi:MAG: HAD-IC family P-type ATPase [Alphaproteobacteria bacterium]|nr:HAD-IC family P-type ATPase [Alphaproteobacteria bacterium]